MTSRLTLLTILLFTFNFQPVHAQDLDTVTISGRVMDQNSAVLPGAEVQAKLIKTGQTRTTTTDAEGRYRLIQLEPGTYVRSRLISWVCIAGVHERRNRLRTESSV